MEDNTYDILIIGSGLGGLLSAALLSKEGFKVIVLEKNKQIGGALQSFGLDGKLFESAVHYIGSMAKGQTLEQLFTYLGIAQHLKLSRLDVHGFDKIILNDKEYALAQGYTQFIDQLSEQFPNQRKGLTSLCDEMQLVCNHFPLYNLNLGSQEEKKKVMHSSLAEKMNAHITDPILKQVLCGNNLLFAGNYSTTPFYLYALIENSYIESSWTFSEGSAQLAKLLQQIITQHGGSVKRNKDVHLIQEENGVVCFVETKDGEQYQAKQVISNLHPV